jgi:hypothetical protein
MARRDNESDVLKMDFFMDSTTSPTIKRVWKRLRADIMESRPTVRKAVQQPQEYICPKCGHGVWLPKYPNALYRCCMAQSCGWRGKRPSMQ